jgi:hypothetical protein
MIVGWVEAPARLNTISAKEHSSDYFQGFRRGMSGERIKTGAESSRIHQPENQTSSFCSFGVLIGRQGSTEGEAALR